MITRLDLIASVEESWRRLDAAVEGLDEAALTESGVVGQWSIKDVLGHVTAWDQLAVEYLERWRRGAPAPERDWDSADDFNAREADRKQGWPLARIRDEADTARDRLRTLLVGINDDEWATPVTLFERERPLGEWVGGALNGDGGPGTHAAEHAEQIQAWRAARGGRDAGQA